jgi:hypothetical protein
MEIFQAMAGLWITLLINFRAAGYAAYLVAD